MNKGKEKMGAELQNSEEQRQRRGVVGELLKKQLENLSPPEETGCDDWWFCIRLENAITGILANNRERQGLYQYQCRSFRKPLVLKHLGKQFLCKPTPRFRRQITWGRIFEAKYPRKREASTKFKIGCLREREMVVSQFSFRSWFVRADAIFHLWSIRNISNTIIGSYCTL